MARPRSDCRGFTACCPCLHAADPAPPPGDHRDGRHGVLGALVLAGWQEQWPSAVFGRAAQQALTWSTAEAPLPVGAVGTANQSAGLDDVAYPNVQNCSAVGYYSPGESGTPGLIETLSRGIWTPAAAPAFVTSSQLADLFGVACPAESTCVAVGTFEDSQGAERPLVETLSGGSWIPAAIALPADANQSKEARLSQVACPAPGTCVAAGLYSAQNGGTQGLIRTLSNGTWTAARAPLPAGDAAANPNAYLWGLACPALWGVACPAPRSCVATGHYTSRNGRSQGLIDTLSDDRWIPATAPLPADAAANQKWSISQPTGLEVAACTAASTCVAAGSYTARSGTIRGEIDTLSNGTWTAARASLPVGAAVVKQGVFSTTPRARPPTVAWLLAARELRMAAPKAWLGQLDWLGQRDQERHRDDRLRPSAQAHLEPGSGSGPATAFEGPPAAPAWARFGGSAGGGGADSITG